MSSLAFGLSLAAALCLALASLLQHDAARAVPHDVGTLRLFFQLLRTPRWLVGRVIDTGALVLQAVALRHGSLIAVQAVLTTSVVLALGFDTLAGRRRVHRREIIGSIAVVAGVAVLLVVGRPRDHAHRSHWMAWVGFFAVVGIGVMLAAMYARGHRDPRRAASVLAVATGACFALDAASLKALAHGGFLRFAIFGAAFALAAITGNVLVQRAFQLAPLNASLPLLTATIPVVGAIAGFVLFHERFRHGLGVRAVAAIAVLIVALGALLAARSSDTVHADAV